MPRTDVSNEVLNRKTEADDNHRVAGDELLLSDRAASNLPGTPDDGAVLYQKAADGFLYATNANGDTYALTGDAVNAQQIQGILVDITGLLNNHSIFYNSATGNFEVDYRLRSITNRAGDAQLAIYLAGAVEIRAISGADAKITATQNVNDVTIGLGVVDLADLGDVTHDHSDADNGGTSLSAAAVNGAGAVMNTDFNGQTILRATSDNLPLPLIIDASSIVGRTAGGNIDSLGGAQVRTIINVQDGAVALPVVDTTSVVKDPVDGTKQVRLDVGAVVSATTRVVTVPDQDVDLTPDTGTFPAADHDGRHVTGGADKIRDASASVDGLATAAQITKLDAIAENANNYTHPNHSGDVTSVADGAQTIANDAVTYAKMQNVSATDRFLGRDTAGAGNVEEIDKTAALAILNVADGANDYTHPNHSGDVTSVADGAQTIAADAVTYAKIQNVSATNRFLGRDTAGAGNVEEIDKAAALAILNVADGADVTGDNAPQAHSIASHDDTTATGTELETLTDGSDADALHTHSADGIDTSAVHESLFDANTILKADSDDTPVALTVQQQTLVGRITSGNIAALSVASVLTLLDIYTQAQVDSAIDTDVATHAALGNVHHAEDHDAEHVTDGGDKIRDATNAVDGLATAVQIALLESALQDVVDDATPQLGGNLDVDGKDIVSVSNGDIVIAAHGTGDILLTGSQVGLDAPGNLTVAANLAGNSATLTTTLQVGTDLTMSAGDIVMSATKTVDGRDVSVDGSKLDGIESSADETDADNVNAAGAVMNSDFDAKGDILSASANNTPLILGVGTNGYFLVADSGEASGLKWIQLPAKYRTRAAVFHRQNPISTDIWFVIWVPYAITFQRICGYVTGSSTPTVTLQVMRQATENQAHVAGTNILSANMVADTTKVVVVSGGMVAGGAVGAGQWIQVVHSATSGTVTGLNMNFEWTID